MDLGHRRRDKARASDHDLDALAGQRFAQAKAVGQQGRLRGGVGGCIGQRVERRQGGDDRDVPAPAAAHAGQHRMDHVDRRQEVGLQHATRRRSFLNDLVGVATVQDAGVGNEEIDRVLLVELGEEGRDPLGIANVDRGGAADGAGRQL